MTVRSQKISWHLDFCCMKKSIKKKNCKKFGKRVRQLRKDQDDMTQDQLAYESGLSREEISRIENGKKAPSLNTLISLSKGFDMPLKELCDFEYENE